MAVAGLVLLAGLILGCTFPQPTTPPPPTGTPLPTQPPAPPTADPRYGGRLTVRLSQEIEQLTPMQWVDDPEARWLTDILYGGLTRLDDRLRPQPDLAERWEVSPDGLVITFTLRPDLRWSDDTPVTAADISFSWELYRRWEPRTGAQADLREYVAAIHTPSEDTVVFILRRRLAALLVDVALPVFPQHVWGASSPVDILRSNLLENPVCSGPFRLQERLPGQALVLERNPYYYGPAPFLQEVAFLVAPDPQVAEMALRRDDLHVALLSRETYRALSQMPPQNPLRLERYPAAQYTFVAFNMHPGQLFEDPNLRQTWAYAQDKDLLVAAVTDGAGMPLWSPILPLSWVYDQDLPRLENDVQLARELLAASGWQDGDGDGVLEKEGQPLRVRLFVRSDSPERIAAGRRMAGSLAQVGMAVEVLPADSASVIAAKLRPPYDFEAILMQWRNLGPDPDLFYLFHSSQAWQGEGDDRENLYNFCGYRSEEADQLILAGRDSYDLEERQSIYVELQRILAQDLPYYMLWGDPIYLAADARLTSPEGPLNVASPTLFWNIERWYWGAE